MTENDRSWIGPLTGKKRTLASNSEVRVNKSPSALESASEATDTAPGPDLRDVLITQLQGQVADLRKEIDHMEQARQDLMERWRAQEEILRRALPAPKPDGSPITSQVINVTERRPRKWALLGLIPIAALCIWGVWAGIAHQSHKASRVLPAKPAAVKAAKESSSPKREPVAAPVSDPAPAKPVDKTPAATPAKAVAPPPTPKPVAHVDPTIYVVHDSSHYHATKCWILGRKRLTSMTLSEAKAKGYTPCRYCGDRVAEMAAGSDTQ